MKIGDTTLIPPCPVCQSRHAVCGIGTGPHAARLDCNSCGRFRKWVGKTELDPLPEYRADDPHDAIIDEGDIIG